MKKYLISTVAVLMVLAVVFAAFGQPESRSGRRPRMSQEERLKAIEAIEIQLVKLKEAPQRSSKKHRRCHGLQVDLQTCPRKREPNSLSR